MKLPLNRTLYLCMRALSAVCNPFYGTLTSFAVLFFLTYLTQIELVYRLLALLLIGFFTILLPMSALYLYRKSMGWHHTRAYHKRERRYVPYLIILMCYIACHYVMLLLSLPRYMSGIIMGAAIAIALSIIANIRWKVSEHMVTMGGAVAGVLMFSYLVRSNPLWLLSIAILLSGALGTSRIILKHHTAVEVGIGWFIGFFSLLGALTYYF